MILCDCKEDLSIAAEELIPLFFILNIKAGALFWLCYMQQEKKNPQYKVTSTRKKVML